MSSDAPDVNRSSRQSISTLPHPLSASPTIFQELVASTCSSTGLDLEKIVHDYWLIRSLYGVAARLPEGGVFKDPLTPKDIRKGRTQETQPVKGVWAFGGGTCLSSAWQVSPRWSEDIDGVILQSDTASKSSFNGIRKQVTDLVAEVVGVKGTTITRTDPIIHTRFEVSEEIVFKMDHALETQSSEQLVSSSAVSGLLARYSDDPAGLCERFPELGGFDLPVIQPAYIAVNKLDALHRRAVAERWEALQERVRDIYDLYHIALHPVHADLCREKVVDWWAHMNRAGNMDVSRPDGGYGTSPIFESGSPAQGILCAAYNKDIQAIAIGTPPPFEEVIATARKLDLP